MVAERVVHDPDCENSTTKSDYSMGYDPNLSISNELNIIEGLEIKTLWSMKFVEKGWVVHKPKN